MMSLTSLVDEGLNKAIKKQTNSNQITLTEIREQFLDDSYDDHHAKNPPKQETEMMSNSQLNTGRFMMENDNSFAPRLYGGRTMSPIHPIRSFSKPRSLSEYIVETNVEEHIKYLDDQNDMIFGLVNEKAAVDQMLNRGFVVA